MIYTVAEQDGHWLLQRDGAAIARFMGREARADADFALIAFTLRDATPRAPVVQPLRQEIGSPEQGSLTWIERTP